MVEVIKDPFSVMIIYSIGRQTESNFVKVDA